METKTELRKVLYKKWIPAEMIKVEGKGYSETKPGTRCYEPDFTHPGIFHRWGVQCEESDSGYGNSTIAIIELPDGTIENVFSQNIKFIDPLK